MLTIAFAFARGFVNSGAILTEYEYRQWMRSYEFLKQILLLSRRLAALVFRTIDAALLWLADRQLDQIGKRYGNRPERPW